MKITRRDLAGLAAGLGLSSGLRANMGLAATPKLTRPSRGNPSSKRPNIIILLADDLGYGDLGCYGHPSIATPALDKMAAEGQRWTDFYAGAPVCSSSRGALMTGMLPVRSGLYGKRNIVFWPDSAGGIPSNNRTIAQTLSEAGYSTVMLGKWHLGDRADALPTRHGFDGWLGTPYSNDMDWVAKPELQQLTIKFRHEDMNADELSQLREMQALGQAQMFMPDRQSSNWNVPLLRSTRTSAGYRDSIVERPAYQEALTKRYTEEAVSFIKDSAARDRPFFLYVAYNMPHRPTFASAPFKGKSLAGGYGDAVEEIDWSVDQVRQTLEECDLAEDTLLVFSSDNGAEGDGRGGSTGLLKGHKGTVFEGGLRVPGIFRWPGHIEPGVVHDIGCLTDLYATVISVAGIQRHGLDDSIDLSPVFQRRTGMRDDLLYYSMYGELLGYRKGMWKVVWTEDGFTPGEKARLHNITENPTERIDLADLHPELAARLLQEAEALDSKIVKSAPLFDQ